MSEQSEAQKGASKAIEHLPEGLIIKYDVQKCPDPAYVDEVLGVVTPSGMINLSLYYDCPDHPRFLKSERTAASEEGQVTFPLPESPIEEQDGYITLTRRIGANVLMSREAAQKLVACLVDQLGAAT